jgi:multidrug efflux pump subunit AcrB
MALGMSPLEAARTSMDEVDRAGGHRAGACAVFVPTLFITGLSGQFYKQFAVTISTATVISLLLSLTLSPALAAAAARPCRCGTCRCPAGGGCCKRARTASPALNG